MEENKIRIGITQGDINGVGYEVILKTFSDPTMLELCTPIIYGSPKVAAYHRKALDVQANSVLQISYIGYISREIMFDNYWYKKCKQCFIVKHQIILINIK